MAFKMKGFSPFTQPKYRDPSTFKGPGGYIKHTAKVIGSKIKGLFRK